MKHILIQDGQAQIVPAPTDDDLADLYNNQDVLLRVDEKLNVEQANIEVSDGDDDEPDEYELSWSPV